MHSFTFLFPAYVGPCCTIIVSTLSSANAQNNNSGPSIHTSVPGNPVVSMAGTNLNMGMDLWNPSAASGTMKMRPNSSRTSVPPTMMGRDGMMPDQWVQV